MGWFWLDVLLAATLFTVWVAACGLLVRVCGRSGG
jgi:hypothetical protein